MDQMLSSDFLAEFKRVTEAKWRERPINPDIYGFQFQQRTHWNPGLSEDKIAEYENVLGVRFPYDFRALFVRRSSFWLQSSRLRPLRSLRTPPKPLPPLTARLSPISLRLEPIA
jgi:hypothetical protein